MITIHPLSESAYEFQERFKISAHDYFNGQAMTVNVFNDKYALTKADGTLETPGETFWRVCSYVASAELIDGGTEEEAFALAKVWFDMMWRKEIVAGGRIIYGAGNPLRVSLNNCTTADPPLDSLESIYDVATKMARALSLGEGIGVDITNLRPEGFATNNSAKTTSGAISWAELYDFTTGTIAQNGRRGALLISIRVTHPETLKFIKVKSDLSKIENANISLQITDDFMQAVIDDAPWQFFWVNGKGEKILGETVPARSIMNEICSHSSKFAEPGLQFVDIASRYSNSDTLGDRYKVVSTNACSEQWLDPWSQCVLSHANWANLPMSIEDAEWEAEHRAYYLGWFLDNVVTMQIHDKRGPSEESMKKSVELRRIGQGFTGLADYLSRKSVAYDSKEGFEIAERLAKSMARGAYERSVEAGAIKGSFTAFDREKLLKSPYIQNMIAEGVLPADFTSLRNVCNITVAPVGSGNLLLGGWANGVEPGIGYIYWRRTRISGEYIWYFFINPFVYELIKDKQLIQNLKLLEIQINSLTPSKERFELEDKAFALLKEANIDFDIHKFSHLVDPMAKADLMGVIQKYVDSAISVTFNMPESTTVEQISDLYVKCWQNKLKGVAIYREDPQNREPIFVFKRPNTYNYSVKKNPLVVDTSAINFDEIESELLQFLKTSDRVIEKRPVKLTGFTETVKAENHKFYFTYNFNEDNQLYEVFCQSNAKEPKVSTENAQNALSELLAKHDVPDIFIEDQIEKSGHQSSAVKVTRLISLGLRHNVPVNEIVKSLKTLDVTVSSYIFHLARGLSQFVEKFVMECPSCKEQTMVVESGCKHCESCGYSGC